MPTNEEFVKEALRLIQHGSAQVELDTENILGGKLDCSDIEVSRSKDGRGAYVAAWVWVNFPTQTEDKD